MKSLHIDFAPRSLRRALFSMHGIVLITAVAGLVLCVGAALSGWKQMQQQAEREHQLHRQRAKAAALQAATAPVAKSAIPDAQAAFVNDAIRQLNLPWRALQDAVAAATPRTVALVALEPDPRKQILKITAEAKSSDDMVAYIEEIKQQELFSNVMLTQHEINEQDANRPLRFQLEATWVTR